MTAPKLTPDQALRYSRQVIFNNGPTIPLTETLAGLGYKLVDKDALVIPTDPASVEDMVERGGTRRLGKHKII